MANKPLEVTPLADARRAPQLIRCTEKKSRIPEIQVSAMEARKHQVRMVSAKEKEMAKLKLKCLDREGKEGYLITPLASRTQIVAEENGAANFTRGGSFVCSEIKLCNQSVELTRFADAHRAAHL